MVLHTFTQRQLDRLKGIFIPKSSSDKLWYLGTFPTSNQMYTLMHIKEENTYLGTQIKDPIAGYSLHIQLGPNLQNFNGHKQSNSKKD